MRTVYLGTSSFASAVLRRLAQSPHRPQLVVTRPDRPRGRGRRLAAPPVAETASELGIEVAQPESINGDDARERIAAVEPETVIVCAFGALITEPLLSDYPMLNVHPSLLPRWRGAAPVERAIMAGDERTGVSIMRLTAGLDSGPVCLTAEEPIAFQDTYGTLAERLQELGGELLVRALDDRPAFVEQDETGVTYAEKIGAEDRLLRGDRSADELTRVVRALTPHIGAAVMIDADQRLGVWETIARPRREGDPPAGELGVDGAVPALGCSEGVLELTVVQPAGRRAMAGDAFLRGLRG